MSWISITISAYLLGALAVLLDKFLLGSKRISKPSVYTFYAGLFSLSTFVIAPFVLIFPPLSQLLLSLFSGAVYLLGIFALYEAINKGEASRVTPVVFSMVPLATYLMSLIFKIEKITPIQLLGVLVLIIGGLLISFDLPLKLNKKKFFSGFTMSCLAGILLAFSYVLFKFVYAAQPFWSGFLWTRLGLFLGALLLLLVPVWRKAIFGSFKHARKPTKEHAETGVIFIANKILGGTSSVLLNFAISLGSVTLINAMVSLQYVFLLLFVSIATQKYPKIFQERLLFWDWAQKVGAILIIAVGMFFISK